MTKKTGKQEVYEEKQDIAHKEKTDKNDAGKGSAKSESKTTNHEKQSEKQDKKQSEDQAAGLNTKIQELTSQVEEYKNGQLAAEESAKDWQDKYIRLSAEFDNYRKRTIKEKSDLIKQANGDLLKDILPVIDDFERGIDHLDKSEDLEGLKHGILLIYNKFIEFVRQNGIKEIEAKEKEFDIDFHEAMTKIPAPAEELKGKVVDVVEKGYLLNDRVLRYAKVVVGE